MQPVTSPPLIEIHPTSKKRTVLFGTGKLLDSTDITSPQEQSFYGILDGSAASFRASVPGPVVRSDLVQLTDLTVPATFSTTTMGWYIGYIDLGKGSAVGWRIVSSPSSHDGFVAFAALLTTGDACSPSGVSRVYAIDFANGTTALTGNVPFVAFTSSITDLRFVSVNGRARLVAGDVRGGLTNIGVRSSPPSGLRLLNWREIPTVD